MRKTWKRVLSLVLSASLVVTAGAFGAVQNGKTAKAAGINFTAFLESWGGFYGWGVTTPASDGAWKVNVNMAGDYTLSMEAPTDWDFSNAFVVETDLTAVPTDYRIIPKTVKIGSQTYDWSKATPYVDGTTVRMSIWNEWGKDDEGGWDPKANPLADDPTTLSIVKGDKIEVTFGVDDGSWFTAFFESWGGFWDWDATTPASDGAWKVTVDKAGDYTLSMEAPADWEFSNAFVVETNLSAVPTDYQIIPKTVKIGSQTYDWSKATPYVDGSKVRMSIWNEWGKDDEGGWDPKANPLADDPTTLSITKGDKIEATFTVTAKSTGGNGGGGGTTTTPDVKKVNGTAKGKTFTAGNFKYKVTTAATITSVTKKTTVGKVTVTGLSAAGKKKTSISLKNTVKKGTASYKVTAIASKAFQKATKLKKATLGSNITTIPANAFNADKKLTTVKATGVRKIKKNAFKGCKVLKKLTLGKKKLTSVAKKSFTGCKKKITVSGGSKSVKKANVKKLKKSGYKKFK